jgi:membrane-associated phospholipid phosphatase
MRRSAAVAVLLLLAMPATAEESRVRRGMRVFTDEVKRYGSDALALARAPMQWDAAMWQRSGAVAAVAGGAFAADQQLADGVQRNRSSASDNIAKAITPLGGGRALQVSAAALLAGLATHNPELRETGRDAIEASILASGVVTPVIKRIAGRSRPNADQGAYDFHPFGGNESFPSGHATNAFAVASVFAAHAKGWVVPAVAYTLASGVAASRVNDNVHYTSDVIVGAAIGTAIGRSIVYRHRHEASSPAQAGRVLWSIAPAGRGVMVELRIPTRF